MSFLFGGEGMSSSLFNDGGNPALLPHHPSSLSHETGNVQLPTRGRLPSNVTEKVSEDSTAGDCCLTVCTTPPEPCVPNHVDIDPRGDLTLVVGETRCRCKKESRKRSRKKGHNLCQTVAFRVCSRSVARAARAFDTMLYGGLAEAEKVNPDWTILLPEDNPVAMETLLQIMHGSFNTFDARSFDDVAGLSALYQITVITDKYDLTHLLRPWAEKLVRGLKPLMDSIPITVPTFREALWISWELGSSDTFESGIQRLSWELDDDPMPSFFFNTLGPPGASDLISSLRREAIVNLLRPPTLTVRDLTEGKICYGARLYCKRRTEANSTCNLLTLATLIQSLHSLALWPLPDSETWHFSASQLQEVLCQLEIQRDPNHQNPERYYSGKPYGACGESIVKDGRVSWYRDIDVILTDEQRNHLKRQAVKLGRAGDN